MLSWCKLSGDPPETLRGGSPDFLAKSLVVPVIYMKFKLIDHKFNVYMAGITNDLASWCSPDDFRRDNIAGPHGILEK